MTAAAPAAAPARRQPVLERFWSHVDTTGDCWLWVGALQNTGYGAFCLGGKRGGLVGAHRFSYELHFGPIPPGLCVRQRCGVPACVRPEHLRAGKRPHVSSNAYAYNQWRPPYKSAEARLEARRATWRRSKRRSYARNVKQNPVPHVAAIHGISEDDGYALLDFVHALTSSDRWLIRQALTTNNDKETP